MNNLVLGVDIGGSHITTVLIDKEERTEIENSWQRNRVNSNGTPEEIIEAWANTMEKSMEGSDARPLKISIAMPGPMDYKKGICKIKEQGKYLSLYEMNLKELLSNRLGFETKNINFMNDAACFLKGELFSGSLRGFEKAIGLTLGTGLGSAHIANGKAIDSDLWRMPFQKGIAEDYISTRWFIKRFEEMSGKQLKDVKDLTQNYQDSPYFKLIFEEFSENLSKFLYKFIRKKMPLAAVIGGNIALAGDYFVEDTRKRLAQLMGYSFPVKISILGEHAALMGAAASF